MRIAYAAFEMQAAQRQDDTCILNILHGSADRQVGGVFTWCRTRFLFDFLRYKIDTNFYHVRASPPVPSLPCNSTSVERVGQRLASGDLQNIKAVPTSERTAEQARLLDIPLTTLDEDPSLSVAIDGADTAVTETFGLVKGGGGALLREKLVAAAAREFVVIVDDSKLAEGLGAAL